jgi:ribulose-5-phosphate 4-epimerase/fuculose-1-phosphate aldolase
MSSANTIGEKVTMKMRTYLVGCVLLIVLASLSLAQNTNTPAGPAPSPAQIAELVLANQILSNENVLDAYGHVSVRDESNPNRYHMTRAIAAGMVTAADIVEYDLDSNATRNTQAAGFSERFIHGQIYKARPDVKAVVHFHAPDVIPFTVSAVPLRAMLHMAGFIPTQVPIFEIQKFGGITDMLVRNNELGKGLADTIADKPLVLLRGHGAVVAGPSLHIAVGRAYYTVANAKIQMQAMELSGGKVTYLDPEEAKKAGDQDGFERGWNFWKYKVQNNK